MLILFDKSTSKRLTDFGSNTSEMTDELWQYVQERFNLTEADVLLGEFDDDFTGKDLSQMLAVITNGVVTDWNAPDFAPEPPQPPQPTELELANKKIETLETQLSQTNTDFQDFMNFFFENNPDLA